MASVKVYLMTSQSDLLLTKIKIPRSRPETILRSRLYRLIETGLNRKLTLLSAPPGSGKTTLLAEWRATPAGLVFPLAWVSLDESDNDPVRFWRYVIAALRTLAPRLGEETLAGLLTPQPASIEQSLTSLINSTLEELDTDFALVLDDYHFIHNQEIHAGVAYLLQHLPSHMHLIITTRTDPLELPLSRLRVRREQIEIRSEDLRFTQEEAASFFEKVLNRPLTPAEIEMVETRIEGWAAGLQLAAFSLHDQQDADSFIRAFRASQRLVLDYLADEVFYHQPKAVQEFLLHTAILGQLNEGLARAVTGQPDSREMLDKLDRDNLFLTSLDNSREWYRYHPLFAEFLVGLLKRTAPERLPELHRRAAQWFEANGFEAEALTHSLEAGDYSKAVELLSRLVLPLVHQGQSVTVMNWFAALPEVILRQNPPLNNLFATALMIANRFDEMEAPLKLAENSFRQQGDDKGGGLAFTLGMRSQLALIRGETETSKALAQRVLELAPAGDDLLQAISNAAIGSNYLFEGAIEEAEDYLSRGWHPWAEPLTRNMLAEAQFMRGNLNHSERQSIELLELGTKNIWQEGFAQVRLARIYYQWNRLREARFYVEQATRQAQPQSAYLPVAYLALARLEWVEGKSELAFQALAKAREMAQRLQHCPLQGRIEAWAHYFKALGRQENDLISVWHWLEDQKLLPLSADHQYNYQKERHYLALVQAMLARGQALEALSRLDWLGQFARVQGRVTGLVEILSLKALALEMAGQDEAALETLSESLRLAAPGNLIRVYLNQGTPMQRLLIRLKPKRPDLALVERLLAAFDSSNPGQSKTGQAKEALLHQEFSSPGLGVSYPKTNFALVEALSDRELEVLRLIEEGISNKAIADRLCLSLATIKTHINHLYAKLEVENRVQALTRARSFNLL